MENTIPENTIPTAPMLSLQPADGKPRDIETVTTEINTIRAQTETLALVYAIEVGRRLHEAKTMLPHGEWGAWLKDGVNFSQSTANNLMKLFDEYGDRQIGLFGAELNSNSQAFGNLTYTKALKLLALPDDEREKFTEENDVENMSTRELDRLIKERDEALKKAEAAEKLQSALNEAETIVSNSKKTIEETKAEMKKQADEIEELTRKLKKVKASEKKAKEQIKELKNNAEVPQETIDKIKEESRAEEAEKAAETIEKRIAEANERIAAAVQEKEAAEKAAREANEKIEELKKREQLSNPDVIEFKTIFESVQASLSRLSELIDRIEDDKTKGSLSAAFGALLEKYEI